MVVFYSPLRYPGGKNKLSKFIALICKINNINGIYVEPYAGGAAVALYLLINGFVKDIYINDLDPGIYSFWHEALFNTEKFCKKIKKIKVNIKNWKKYKKIHSKGTKNNIFDLGFATFFLNRTNRSGIIDAGVIGGTNQKGKYKINCRFNKENLIKKIRLIAAYKEKIHLSNLDAIDLIKLIKSNKTNTNLIFYFDPPYFLKGPSLYMNYYKEDDHKQVSREIRKIKNMRWIVSYDNTPKVKKLYLGFKKIEYSLLHVAYKVREGKEILFFSKNLIVPKIIDPTKIASTNIV